MPGGVCGIGYAGGFRQFLSVFGLWRQPFSGILDDRKRLKSSIKYIVGSDCHEITRQRLQYLFERRRKKSI